MRKILFVYPEPYFISAGGISTYLQHAIRAHLAAGHAVHLLTWLTPFQEKLPIEVTDELLAPLDRSRVTILKFSREQIDGVNDFALLNKKVSDLLVPEIVRLEKEFAPDVIEGTDYCYPLHSYLQQRRCGVHTSSAPTITFCHGLMQDIYPASAVKPSAHAMLEMVHERQVLQWSHHVFAPSEAAAQNIADEIPEARARIRLVREPYSTDRWELRPELESSSFIYFGRISFAKGVDIFARMLSAISESWPISSVALLGRLVRAPFKQSDWRDYCRVALPSALYAKTRFLAPVDRFMVGEVIARYSFFVNFSRSEAFSYSTLEAISRGVAPLVIGSSPMVEFFPPSIRDKVTFRANPESTQEIVAVLSYWRDNYSAAMGATQRYVAALTEPLAYAAAYKDIRPVCVEIGDRSYDGADVTVLSVTCNDAQALRKAVESVERQTRTVREFLVVDAGTTDERSRVILRDLEQSGRIRLLSAPGISLGGARNLLASAAETALIIYLDASESLCDRYVDASLRALNTNPKGVSAVITQRRTRGGDVKMSSCFVLDTPLHWLCNELTMTALIKRPLLETLRFDASGLGGEAGAWGWWLRFTNHGYRAVFVPEPLCWQHSTQPVTTLSEDAQKASALVLLKQAAREAARLNAFVPPIDWMVALVGQGFENESLLRTALAQEKRLLRRVFVRSRLASVLGEEILVNGLRLMRQLASPFKRAGASFASVQRAAGRFRVLATTQR